jgi:Alpha/beta hydrolase family
VDFISARTDPVGGAVSSSVSPPNFVLRAPRLVLLIHGYNVSLAGGEQSFTAFLGLLSKYGITELSIFGHVVGFLWPGDVNIRVIGGLFYPAKIDTAIDSAAVLALFLRQLKGPGGAPIQVVAVSHSLGNRVGLEMINDLLAPAAWGRVESMCLMAAAVPVALVEDNAHLAPAASAVRTRNLFSTSDSVLHWAFPPGETVAGEGFFPQAIGLFGNPPARWGDQFNLQPYNHGNYFYGLGTDDRSARYVAQFLGAAVPNAIFASALPTNSLPPPNTIAGRTVGTQ